MKHRITTTILSLITVFSVAVQASPEGYAIDSDSANDGTADSLYRIDLATGAETRLGRIQLQGQTKLDTEGLAFAPDGTLYGVDDDSMTLFPIDTSNGAVVGQKNVNISGMPTGGGNDFGLTFACDGNLYATSVATQSLYRLSPDGKATVVGSLGAFGVNISALAAYGNPVKLYGLGNGLTGDGTVDSRTLYEINTETGHATPKPQQLGAAVEPYNQAGLEFDSDGKLWAITDRRSVLGQDYPSQIITINTTTGVATNVASTKEVGYESLAIAPPQGCNAGTGDDTPEVVALTVSKEWLYSDPDLVGPDTARMRLDCHDVLPGGDGELYGGNNMIWQWDITGDDSRTANIYPNGTGNTFCYVTELNQSSEVELTSGCEWGVAVDYGGADQSCTVINTVFLEGIPTLNQYGLLLFALLMLSTGTVALRRF